MTFDEMLAQVLALLQREKRVSYRALKRRFDLDDDALEDVKDELIYAKKLAVDEDNRVLVWTGDQATSPPPPVPSISEPIVHSAPDREREPLSYTPKHLAEKILTSRSALEGERKQVTVLFCDLANSTPIAERIGPEAMHTLLNRFFEVALNEVHRYEGTINQFLGDGFMALFGAPLAHEDHARRAVLAALALQRTLQEADLGKPYGEACQFRMGLNSGLVVVGSIGDNLRMDYSAIGDTTNFAARLQQIAEPGTILVSESTTRLVQGAVRLEALAPVEVKGKTEPVPIYTVIGTLLEETDEPFWLGMGVYILGLLYNVTGACHRAVEVATRVHALGEMMGDRRLQTGALLTIGWSYTLQGGWETGIEALQHALSLSPDAFESAWGLGLLGHTYLGQGNVSDALPILEQAVLEANQYRSRQVQYMFQRFLSEAYLIQNNIEKSLPLAQQALELGKAIQFPLGIGAAQCTLGRIAHTTGNLPQAQTYLQASLATFDTIQARYELARTHLDLASIAHSQGNQDTATTHLSTAHAWFQKLQVPKWGEKTEQLAHDYGVTLTEVVLEEWTEGHS